MSEVDGTTHPVAYDAAELRRRIAVCFSVSELRQLAESLGVSGTVAWDRGTQEAVRDLVKQFERYYGLEILVTKLREMRPLVEWPEPIHVAAPASAASPGVTATPVSATAPVSAPAPALTAAPSPTAAPTAAPAPTAAFAPAVFPLTPPPVAPTIAERDAGPPIQDPLIPASSTASPAAPPPSRAAPYWPGISSAPAEPSKPKGGLDPRILIAVAGLTLLAALVAYFAGRASTTPAKDASEDATSAGARAPLAKRPDGPATRVAAALTRTLAAVGRVCEVPPGTPKDAAILSRAFEQCGPAPPPPRPTSIVIPKTPPPDTPPQSADRPPPRSNAGGRDTSKPAANPCMTACESSFRACKDGCGAEPTQSSQYDNYQLCRGRCLTTESRCRLSCPQ